MAQVCAAKLKQRGARIAYKDSDEACYTFEEVEDRRENHVKLDFVGPELLGRHKYLGAATCCTSGVLWGIPGHARCALRIDPYADALSESEQLCVSIVQPELNRNGINRYKWLRGVSRADGTILGLPMHGDAVLKIEDFGHQVTLLPCKLPAEEFKWHGGCVGKNGCAYAVPCRADCVLKVDSKDNVSFFGSLPAGGCKWYGGVYSPRNDSMYCIPFSASRVLKVSLQTDDCVEIGPDLGTNLAKWHGGLLGPDGQTIYGFPAHAQSVLMIRVDTDEVALVGNLDEEHNGGRYKYGGGCVANGNVYGIPSDATSVLKIMGSKVTRFGSLERRNNKWQNGALGRDGNIYCVPCDADAVLVIDPLTDALRLVTLSDVQGTIGGPLEDKFQGGYADFLGRIWCIPENSRKVLKVTPSEVSDYIFVEAYLRRLDVDRGAADLPAIVESHVANIPFENIDNHIGRAAQPAALSRVSLYEKLLVRRRGGDCFELNCGLFYLLKALGHKVDMLPCRVYAGKERGRPGKPGFRAAPSHHALLVDEEWFVDVGFGEGPISPLRYTLVGVEQVTAEGMRSRIVHAGDARLQLEWNVDGNWIPRLQWNRANLECKRPLGLYRERDFVLNSEHSNLNRKLIVSRLTRERKITVSGTLLKVTQPRFQTSAGLSPVVSVVDLDSCKDNRRTEIVRAALLEYFGIPLRETLGLDLQPSRSSPPGLWGHL